MAGECPGRRQVKLRKARIGYAGLRRGKNAVSVRIREANDYEKAYKELRSLSQPLSSSLFGGNTNVDLDVAKTQDNQVTLTLTEPALIERISSAIGSAIETIRRRVDGIGHHRTQYSASGPRPYSGTGAGFRRPRASEASHR